MLHIKILSQTTINLISILGSKIKWGTEIWTGKKTVVGLAHINSERNCRLAHQLKFTSNATVAIIQD